MLAEPPDGVNPTFAEPLGGVNPTFAVGAVALMFDPQTLQNRASVGRLVPHFEQVIVAPSME
jgi:hypothetical protein